MRIKVFNRGLGVMVDATGIINDRVVLAEEGNSALSAVTKLYVDNASQNLSASLIVSGTLSQTFMPAFTGAATSTAGNTSNFMLEASGVTPGWYTKYTTDGQGRITAGTTLTASDIPNLNWSNVTETGTSVASYGITDAFPLSGGNIPANIALAGPPTTANEAATKGYAQSVLGGPPSTLLPVGSISVRPDGVDNTGYLRCNGATLSKTTYAALYAVIGDTFNVTSTFGAGQPWRQQYGINTEQSTDITGWTTGTPLPGPVWQSQAIVTKNRVYLLNASAGNGPSTTVYTAPINTDGTLGTWTTGTPLPGLIYFPQAIVTKNRVYLLGGGADNTLSATFYTAPINTDGTLGTWTTGTAPLGIHYYSRVIVTNNRVYLLGGFTGGGALAAVYTAPINTDGTLGTWTTGTSLSGPVHVSQVIVTKNRVYLLGGSGGAIVSSAAVYTAPITADGTIGEWTTGTSLPGPVHQSQAIVTKNRVYLLGGNNGSTLSATVYTAPINTDGTLGTWTTGTSLPGPVQQSQAIVTKNRVYLLGGYGDSGASATVYTAPISGGLNDYSPYYDIGNIIVTPDTDFALPNLTAYDPAGTARYIKT